MNGVIAHEVRYLRTKLHMTGMSEEQLFYQLAPAYAYTCQEALEGFGTAQGMTLNFSPEAQSNFASTIRNFSQSEYIPMLGSWGIDNPEIIRSNYERFLREGNCPPNSPGVLRPQLIREYGILEGLFMARRSETSEQIVSEVQKTRIALEEGFFEDQDLRNLLKIRDIVHSPQTRRIGAGLIILNADEDIRNASKAFNFGEFINSAVNFDPPQWRARLDFNLSVLRRRKLNQNRAVDVGSAHPDDWDWEAQFDRVVYDEKSSMKDKGLRIYKSLLLLIDSGEVDLASLIIDSLRMWDDYPTLITSLAHVTAAQKLNPARRGLAKWALSIAVSEDSNGYPERPLAANIIALMSYQGRYPKFEGNILEVISKLLTPQDAIVHDPRHDDFIIDFIDALIGMYEMHEYDFDNERLTYNHKNRLPKIKAVMERALEFAITQELTPIRKYLLFQALRRIRDENNMEEALRYFEPLSDPNEQDFLAALNISPDYYWHDYLRRKKSSGGSNRGNPDPSISFTPQTPPVSTPSGAGAAADEQVNYSVIMNSGGSWVYRHLSSQNVNRSGQYSRRNVRNYRLPIISLVNGRHNPFSFGINPITNSLYENLLH